MRFFFVPQELTIETSSRQMIILLVDSYSINFSEWTIQFAAKEWMDEFKLSCMPFADSYVRK